MRRRPILGWSRFTKETDESYSNLRAGSQSRLTNWPFWTIAPDGNFCTAIQITPHFSGVKLCRRCQPEQPSSATAPSTEKSHPITQKAERASVTVLVPVMPLRCKWDAFLTSRMQMEMIALGTSNGTGKGIVVESNLQQHPRPESGVLLEGLRTSKTNIPFRSRGRCSR